MTSLPVLGAYPSSSSRAATSAEVRNSVQAGSGKRCRSRRVSIILRSSSFKSIALIPPYPPSPFTTFILIL